MRSGASQLGKKLRTQSPNPQSEKRCLFHSWKKEEEKQNKGEKRAAGGAQSDIGTISIKTGEGGLRKLPNIPQLNANIRFYSNWILKSKE